MPGRVKGGDRGPLPRNVQISKKLAWLLRHGASDEGIQLDQGGFANVHKVLTNRKLAGMKVTLDELRAIVEGNDKQRFNMVPVLQEPAQEGAMNGEGPKQPAIPSTNPKDWMIRANQGHSLKIESEGLLTPITIEDIPETAVHGTSHAAWPLIVASGGLKPMRRNHVHFASGLPSGFQSVLELDKKTDAAAPVISGMRQSSTVLVYLDMKKAMDAGLKFGRSDNGVVLTEGNEHRIVPLDFFKRVEDRTGLGVLVEDGKVVQEAPAGWEKGKEKG